MSRYAAKGRVQTVGEEIANSVSHGIGFLAALVATPFLINAAVNRGTTASVVGVSIFAATMMLMYLTSTLYHGVPHPRAKQVLRILDHNAIFLLIAGTYTPILLGVFYGTWGWVLLSLVWSLALAGVILKTASGHKYHGISMAIYVGMGWIVVIFAKPLFEFMPLWGIFWLILGGLFYTGGILFYRNENMPYAHAIWHLFVLAGTVCHFISIIAYAL